MNNNFKLIVIIVNKGRAHDVIEASKEAGAEGSTVIDGRGASVRDKVKIFGIPIEPEKEIVLILVETEKIDQVLEKITKHTSINEPGKGIAFTIEVEKVIGI